MESLARRLANEARAMIAAEFAELDEWSRPAATTLALLAWGETVRDEWREIAARLPHDHAIARQMCRNDGIDPEMLVASNDHAQPISRPAGKTVAAFPYGLVGAIPAYAHYLPLVRALDAAVRAVDGEA